jgi:cob(I)alamin adenosyltransferase
MSTLARDPAKRVHQPVKGPRTAKGLVIVNTGEGKGKTTAALGVLLRAWGRGFRVLMLQFVKRTDFQGGEHLAAERLGIEIRSLGEGCTHRLSDLEPSKALAQEQWHTAQEVIRSGRYAIVVLDELTYPVAFGWVSLPEVIATLRERPSGQHVIITGRGAPPELVEAADLVTEMREIKHPYRRGVKAQPGIDL